MNKADEESEKDDSNRKIGEIIYISCFSSIVRCVHAYTHITHINTNLTETQKEKLNSVKLTENM